jgi:hypothetical protein
MIDLKPTDPIEGILISQIMAAHEASLSLYRRAWARPPEYLETRLKYVALALRKYQHPQHCWVCTLCREAKIVSDDRVDVRSRS